jgi:hypothetical protein
VIGHLDLLEMAGKIAAEEKHEVIVWKLLSDPEENV